MRLDRARLRTRSAARACARDTDNRSWSTCSASSALVAPSCRGDSVCSVGAAAVGLWLRRSCRQCVSPLDTSHGALRRATSRAAEALVGRRLAVRSVASEPSGDKRRLCIEVVLRASALAGRTGHRMGERGMLSITCFPMSQSLCDGRRRWDADRTGLDVERVKAGCGLRATRDAGAVAAL